MEENLKKKKRTRGGHRSFVKKTLGDVKGLLEAEKPDHNELFSRKATLEEKLELLHNLDTEILGIMEELDDTSEDALANEIEEAGILRADIKAAVRSLNEALRTASSVGTYVESTKNVSHQPKTVRVKLPKLEIRKFDGKVERWQEFWDSFSSAVDNNADLSDVDKFSYLRGLLKDQARDSISGYALTAANYSHAKELLQKRYGRTSLIQRTHLKEMLQLPPIFSDREPSKLRQLYDAIETHHRGLQALKVEQETYAKIVVPTLLEKLPESVRLNISRGKRHEEWNMDELLCELLSEVELREEHSRPKIQRNERGSDNRDHFRTATTLMAKSEDERCAYCLGNHAHENCQNVSDARTRKTLARKYGRCFCCLNKGHLSRDCRKKVNCKLCSKSCHHVSLCESPVLKPPFSKLGNVSPCHASPNMHVGSECRVVLQTAQGNLKGKHSEARVRVMFDSGSHKSFVTSKAVQAAGLKAERKEWLEITTFGKSTSDSRLREVFNLEIASLKGHASVKLEAFCVESIAQIRNEHVELKKREYPHLRGLWFSDVCKTNDVFEVDVLIGSDYLWLFQSGNTVRGRANEPVAVETSLGWVLSGQVRGPISRDDGMGTSQASINFIGQKCKTQATDDIHRLWDFDSIGIREGNEVHEALKEGISFTGERYEVKLPWKAEHEPLPTNYSVSVKRLKGQLTKLRQEPDILHEYDNTINDQLKCGIIEPVIELEKPGKVHYLPHHAIVRKEAKTTKVRVVYDASCKEGKNGVSLNDCLHVGPPLTPLLYDIILRFREKRIALAADVEKAFLNVEIAKEDRDVLRFLWVDDVNASMLTPIVFRFCRVVFGVNCSPFLLNATLRYHLDKYESEDQRFVRKLKNSFYVDDLVSGDQTEEDTIELYRKSKGMLSDGGFTLRKWLTNSPKVQEIISHEEGKEVASCISESGDVSFAKCITGLNTETKFEKVLGLPWDFKSDTFHFELGRISAKAVGKTPTRRNILSILAALYDPLGIVSPIAVRIKILVQEICKNNLDWDDEIGDEMRNVWNAWTADLDKVQEIIVNRCLYASIDKPTNCTLHGFSDASVKAYCAVIYFVHELNGAFHVELLTSKTRIAPMKTQTIPRLELMSALILARLMSTVLHALECEVRELRSRYWVDSKTVLCWIDNKGEWKQFVRHRVNEILKLSERVNWGHCPGEQNPADVGSRGCNASSLKCNDLWWRGSHWLSSPECIWPTPCHTVDTEESRQEIKRSTAVNSVTQIKNSLSNIFDIGKFGKLHKLLRVTALVLRFAHNLRAKRFYREKIVGSISARELKQSEEIWVKEAQTELTKQGNCGQLIQSLGIVEKGGMLRCQGRLKNSELNFEGREPRILPREHKLTVLIVTACHEKVLHSGLRATLAEVRSRFWIPKGRQTVKNIIGKCLTCRRHNGKAFPSPETASLPAFRVRQAAPFTNVGVDFAGPLYIKEGKEPNKVYITLWTCCVTRAVHLDLVRDLSTSTFIKCLRRFISRRGRPSLIISDNAKTFKAAAKLIKNVHENDQVNGYLANNHIEWRFNLEKSPWWGGFFERMIGTVKRLLRKILGNARLTYDELLTNLVEIEGVINSRPLTYEYNETDVEALTPSHLIFGYRLESLHDDKICMKDTDSDEVTNLRKRYKFMIKLRNHFWNRWKREYLTDLREFHKGKCKMTGLVVKIGDVVLVYDEGLKRGFWKMAIVERLITGKDGIVRGATVRIVDKGRPKVLNRPLQRLYPLELPRGEDREVATMDQDGKESVTPQRPRQAAALDSSWKSAAMLEP